MKKDWMVKRHFAETMARLLREKSVEEITVGEIITASGMSRSTFYRHFNDKYALMNWIFTQYIDAFSKQYTDIRCYKQLIFDIASFLSSSRAVFLNCFSHIGQNSFNECCMNCTTEWVADHLKHLMNVEQLSRKDMYIVTFNSTGVLQTLHSWLADGCKESPVEISQIIIESMPEKIKQHFLPTYHDTWDLVHTPSEIELF